MIGQLPTPVQSAGFPANYPYASSSPLPSALLRPLQQPLYDTDIIQTAATQNQIAFFQRAQGQNTAGAIPVVKTAAETNLSQSGQLANPLEHSVFGYNVVVQGVGPTGVGVTLADFNAIMTSSVFTFLYTGNRVYLQVPLNRLPAGVGPEGFASAATTVAATTINNLVIKNGVGHISNLYKFTISKSALRIRPTENFQAQIAWPNGAPTITADSRIQVFVVGLLWSPL